MTSEALKKIADEMDLSLGSDMGNGRVHSDLVTMRATIEVAYQLAMLNENGIALSNVSTRGSNLCVSIEQNIDR